MNPPFRVGLAGLGTISPVHTAAMQAVSGSFQLVGACDPDPRTHAGVSCPVYLDIESLLDQIPMDLLVVATPPVTRTSVAMRALTRGIDVCLEKPPAMSAGQFDAMEVAASSSGSVLYAAFHVAFGREVAWFIQNRAALEKQLGPPSLIEAEFIDPYLDRGQIVPAAQHLNGSWADSGSNALSVIARLVDSLRVVERRLEVPAGHASDIAARARVACTYEPGTPGFATITTRWEHRRNQKSTLITYAGRAESILLDHSRSRVVRFRAGRQEVLFATGSPESRRHDRYVGVYTDLSECLRERKDNRAVARRLVDALWGAAPA